MATALERELARINIGIARKALMASVETTASQPNSDPTVIARFAQALQDGKVQPEDALMQVHEDMQKAQAAQAAAGPQPGGPQPGAMPGIAGGPPGGPGAAPGVGGGLPMPAMQQGALSSILSNLRKPAAQSGPEQALAGAAPSPLGQ